MFTNAVQDAASQHLNSSPSQVPTLLLALAKILLLVLLYLLKVHLGALLEAISSTKFVIWCVFFIPEFNFIIQRVVVGKVIQRKLRLLLLGTEISFAYPISQLIKVIANPETSIVLDLVLGA